MSSPLFLNLYNLIISNLQILNFKDSIACFEQIIILNDLWLGNP